ncbi:MAG: hypothetical protein WCH34_11115 [Bacteroidota bacterium]
MDDKVRGTITPANTTAIVAIPAEVETQLPFLINLTKDERKTMRKMGTKKAGFVADAHAGALAHTDELPANYDVSVFTEKMLIMATLPYLRQELEKIVEKMRDTEMQLGHELMQHADFTYEHLKLGSKENAPVKEIVGELGATYKGQGKKKAATAFTIAAQGEVTVSNVVTGKLFVNNGTTILKFKPGNNLPTAIKSMPEVTVNPGNSAKIASGWTTITVSNVSATAEGSFAIRVK